MIDLNELKAEIDAAALDEFARGYMEAALFSSSIEDLVPQRVKALQEEIAGARRLGRDPQRQLCELADLTEEEPPAPDTSMRDYGLTIDDIDEIARQFMRRDCLLFCDTETADLNAYCERMGEWRGSDTNRGANATYTAWEQAGADFWLTRNGHGSGFSERGLGELGERLARSAKGYGESNLYTGDDGRIYVA